MKQIIAPLVPFTFMFVIVASFQADAVMPPYERLMRDTCRGALSSDNQFIDSSAVAHFLVQEKIIIGGQPLTSSEATALGNAFSIYFNPTPPNLMRFRSELGTLIEVFSPKSAAELIQIMGRIHLFSISFPDRTKLLLDLKYLSQNLSKKINLPPAPLDKLQVFAVLLSFMELSASNREDLVRKVNERASYLPQEWTAVQLLESMQIIPNLP